ncbi:surface protease GP63 [Trypanosoma grayi]|uniref:surface protease GP63 n=1 Tax=Trypanosoma grayi TaxID=71804 RepID=UPI0004F45790|nr:surface protease GP63 [Trypanosoma grayi]KEG11903.1 surface protease GP63 [Trypanosoma grayi]
MKHYNNHSYHWLLLFLLCCASACLGSAQHHCGFGELMRQSGTRPLGIVAEVPKKGESAFQAYTAAGSDGWAPLRIVVSTRDLDNTSKYCNQTGVERSTFFSPVNCTESMVLTPEKIAAIKNPIIPAAVKLHTDRLLVQPVSGPLKVPEFAEGSVCKHFTVPSEHHTTGVSNADMVLYVAAGPSERGALVWGAPCAMAEGRPVVGALNIPKVSTLLVRFYSRIAAHGIAHALGFSYEVMVSRGMVANITNVRGKAQVTVVNSSKTVEKARAHYGCDELTGMELEDEDAERTTGSHWERRNAKDELMAAPVGLGTYFYTALTMAAFEDMGFFRANWGMEEPMSWGSNAGVGLGTYFYTALTMAAFEDMGFFRANWGMEEPMSWGSNAGCGLLKEKCMTNGATKYPDMFCSKKGIVKCSSDRFGFGACEFDKHESPLPERFRYFTSPDLGAPDLHLTDHCPILVPERIMCSANAYGDILGNIMGEDSWCLDGNGLFLNTSKPEEMPGVCAAVQCADGVVKVRYGGDDTWHSCPEGGLLTPSSTSQAFVNGTIKCPKYTEVCTVAGDGSSRIAIKSSPDTSGRSSSSTFDGGNKAVTAPKVTSDMSSGNPDSAGVTVSRTASPKDANRGVVNSHYDTDINSGPANYAVAPSSDNSITSGTHADTSVSVDSRAIADITALPNSNGDADVSTAASIVAPLAFLAAAATALQTA